MNHKSSSNGLGPNVCMLSVKKNTVHKTIDLSIYQLFHIMGWDWSEHACGLRATTTERSVEGISGQPSLAYCLCKCFKCFKTPV